MNPDNYERARQLLTDTNRASISLMQRKIGLSVWEAFRMMERVESEGLVSPANGKGAEGLLAVHKHDAFRWENAMRHDQHSAPLGEPRPNISKRKNHYKRYYTATLFALFSKPPKN